MPKQIVLDQITLCADGSIGIRWLKQVTDPDTGEVLFSEPHRGMVDIDGDLDESLAAVNLHLASMGYMPPKGEAERAKSLVAQIDALAKSDPTIEATRAAKLEQRQES